MCHLCNTTSWRKNYSFSEKDFTLTIFLANFSVAYARSTPWHLYMAAALLIISPCLVLFFFSQNAFLKGITITDFKR